MSDGWKPLEGHHYTVRELAEEWNASADYIRDLFEEEPGVVIWVRRKPGRRAYRIMRIPWNVAQRLYRRSQVAA